MRLVFVDEAGTKEKEPVTVVVGIIADADEHVVAGEAAIKEAFAAVPEAYRKGFIFHATQVMHDRRYYDHWSQPDRLSFLQAMMNIPMRLGMALVVAAQYRDFDSSKQAEQAGLTPVQLRHAVAFSNCVVLADQGIRKYAAINEIGVVVSEDIPELRKSLRGIPQRFRDNPELHPSSDFRETPSDKERGVSPGPKELRVDRIRGPVHFVKKHEDAMLQLADACAYGLRRYFAGLTYGVDFARAVLWDEANLRDFGSPGGAQLYWPQLPVLNPLDLGHWDI